MDRVGYETNRDFHIKRRVTYKMAPGKSALPSFTLCVDVSHCLGTILVANGVDLRVKCCIMALFVRRVTRTLRTFMCVSTEIRGNVTNHRGQSEISNLASNERPTCDGFLPGV